MLYAFATSFIAVILDELGSTLVLWTYPMHILPLLPRLITVNYTFVPIIFSLLYQHFPSWKAYIAINLLTSAVFAFILEPILVWAKLYVLDSWKYAYSIPLYVFSAVILKWFIENINFIQGKYRKGFAP